MTEVQSPKVTLSIVVPAYNEEKTIAACIQAIKKQDTDIPYKIIVINNASTDNTATTAALANVTVITEPKKGLYYARQRGLESVNSEYIMYVDADSELPHHWVRKAITFLQTHPDFVAVSGNYYFKDAKFLFKPLHIFSQFVISPFLLLIFRLFRKPDFLIGTAFMVRTKILKQVGGFNKEFPFYGEDMAMGQKLSTAGKIKFFPTLFVYSSARRYNTLGLFKTHLFYYKVAFYIVFGNIKKAAQFSQQYNINK